MKFMIEKATGMNLRVLLVLPLLNGVKATGCPFLKHQEDQQNALNFGRQLRSLNAREGDWGIPEGGFEAVKSAIIDALTDSKDFFPADFEPPHGPNYGPLMVRLAWHCAGSYRDSDGRGGCDGGRIRFEPELTWMDNGNLDKGLEILKPIKEKFGSSLSWGDLIILAGNAAIESMGGPILGFCGGRIDDADGSNSLILGPSEEQEAIAPCLRTSSSNQTECFRPEGSPLGPTTVGLIYVNPAGPAGSEGDAMASAADIRKAFARMGFNDTESVALIGGGHAFGKCHGACNDPPCGRGTDMEGIGLNTFTSGFEGAWTTTPTTWSNQFFRSLFDFEWNLITGPGGNIQWAPSSSDGATAPDIMMLTTDIALSVDEAYKSISEEYAKDLSSLENDFKHAWYELTTADMGPVSRCIGENVPPPQNFQSPLPEAPGQIPDFVPIRAKIQELLDADKANVAAFVNLAYRCASTYRDTDYKGGCNGARIRFSPEKDWESNVGTAEALKTLEPVREDFSDASMSDIIVLAGQTAIEDAGGKALKFCGGRVDADDADGSEILAPRSYEPAVVSIRDDMQVKGLTAREGVALAGRPTGPTISNQFYKDLLAGNGEFTEDQLALLMEEFKPIVEEYAEKEDIFLTEFARAWTKMMIADRFDGPMGNVCTDVDTPTIKEAKGGEIPKEDNGENKEADNAGTKSAGVSVASHITALIAAGAGFSLLHMCG